MYFCINNKKLDTSIFVLFILSFCVYCFYAIENIETIKGYEDSLAYQTTFVIIVSFVYAVCNLRFLYIEKSVKLLFIYFAYELVLNVIAFDFAFEEKKCLRVILNTSFPFLIFLVLYIFSNRYGIKRLGSILLCVFIYLSISYLIQYRNVNELRYGNSFRMASLNSVYIPMLFFPIVTFVSGKNVRIILFIIMSILLYFSMKRAGIIAFCFSLLVFAMIAFYRNHGRKIIIKYTAVIAVIFLGIIGFLKSDFISDSYLISRFTKINIDGGEERVYIYKDVLNRTMQSSFFEHLFGHGYLATVDCTTAQTSAHNDFLEIYYDYGVFLFLIYLSLHVLFIGTIIEQIRRKDPIAPYSGMMYTFFLILSLVSHVMIYTLHLSLFLLFWGVVYGSSRKKIVSRTSGFQEENYSSK